MIIMTPQKKKKKKTPFEVPTKLINMSHIVQV
jgi:hypothetical protein